MNWNVLVCFITACPLLQSERKAHVLLHSLEVAEPNCFKKKLSYNDRVPLLHTAIFIGDEIRKHLLHFTSGKHTRRSELLSQHSVPLLQWEISQCKKVPVHVLNLNIAKDLMN